MRPTTPTLALALALAAAPAVDAQVTLQVLPSGRGTTQVTLQPPRGQEGAAQPATITLDYGQPHLRGRTLHTGDLVPYDVAWRTGANASTTLTTGVNLTIGGIEVPSGRYLVYTLPTRSAWTLILQRAPEEESMQAAMQYDASRDFARIPLRRRELPMPIESLKMWLIPATCYGPPLGEMRILWGSQELSADWVVR